MTKLHWEIHPGNGPFLLLVHGFLSSRAQWLPNLKILSQYSTPVCVELWGHGRSPRADSADAYFPQGYVAQFEAIRVALGTEQWLLCGQSLGAALTLRYALSHPERVIAQVFTNSNSALASAEMAVQRSADALTAIEAIEQNGLSAVEALRVHPRHAKRLPADIHAQLLDDARQINPMAVADSYRHLNPIASVRQHVATLQVPTLLAAGRFEKRFVPQRRFAEETIPGLITCELDAGHAVNIQAAESFNKHVRDFFRSHL